MLDAYRRAYELDPLWSYAQVTAVTSSWGMGLHDEALAYVRRVESDDSAYDAHVVRSALAQVRGDLSGEALEWGRAATATTDPGRRSVAIWSQGMAYNKLGLVDLAYEMRRRAGDKDVVRPDADPRALIRQGNLPTFAELERRNRNIPFSWEDTAFVGRAARLLINAGRAADIVRLYDGPGILQISGRRLPALPARRFTDGPVIAAALRAVGRNAEADKILAHLDREIDAALRRSGGRAPPYFFIDAAQTWAMRGKRALALTALEGIGGSGRLASMDFDDLSLNDFGAEPAFKSLRGEPRFEAIRRSYNDFWRRNAGRHWPSSALK